MKDTGFVNLKVEGLSKLFNNLEKASVKTLDAAHRRMYILTSSAADATRVQMRGWIWDTGNLAGSLDHLVRWEGKGLSGYVFTPVEYGIYVHFGTKRMPARPFMDIAINFMVENAARVFKGLI